MFENRNKNKPRLTGPSTAPTAASDSTPPGGNDSESHDWSEGRSMPASDVSRDQVRKQISESASQQQRSSRDDYYGFDSSDRNAAEQRAEQTRSQGDASLQQQEAASQEQPSTRDEYYGFDTDDRAGAESRSQLAQSQDQTVSEQQPSQDSPDHSH